MTTDGKELDGEPQVLPVAAAGVHPAGDDDGQTCDGLHDEDAPLLYLCSRCFPYGAGARGDLADLGEDEGYEAHRDEDREMG